MDKERSPMLPRLKLTDEESPLRWPLYVPAGQSRKSLHPADITTRLVSPQLRVAAARVKGLHCNISLTAYHQVLLLSLRYNLPQFNWIAGFSSANSYVPDTEMRRARPSLSPHRASRAGSLPSHPFTRSGVAHSDHKVCMVVLLSRA